MAPVQKEWLTKFGHKGISIDSTHGINAQEYLLTTLMVVDEVGKGLPAAFLISRSEKQENLEPWFEAIKEQVGEIKPAFFMSDDANAFWNAYTAVFGAGETQKLLCSWHIHRNWKAQLKAKVHDEDDRAYFYSALLVLLYETSEEEFRQQATCFLTESMELGTEEGSLHHYLKTHYFAEDRLHQWVAWKRLGNTSVT